MINRSVSNINLADKKLKKEDKKHILLDLNAISEEILDEADSPKIMKF